MEKQQRFGLYYDPIKEEPIDGELFFDQKDESGFFEPLNDYNDDYDDDDCEDLELILDLETFEKYFGSLNLEEHIDEEGNSVFYIDVDFNSFLDLAYETTNHKPFFRDEKKIGRNKPCICGSGKKYKNCCG